MKARRRGPDSRKKYQPKHQPHAPHKADAPPSHGTRAPSREFSVRDEGRPGRPRSGKPRGVRDGEGQTLKGKLIRQGGFHFVQAAGGGNEDNLILIPRRFLGQAQPGDTVAVRLISDDDGERVGKIIAGLAKSASFTDVSDRFFKEYGIPRSYPKPAALEADALPEPFFIETKRHENHERRDWRDRHIVTIDPSTAKDHDDAISLEKKPDGSWLLGVHIADVSEYVKDGGALDREALRRAFTQYLPWTAAPMLPHRLSSDLCSLLEGRERFAFTCFMDVGPQGELLRFEFAETFIRVAHFYSYEEAQADREAGDPFLTLLDEFTSALTAKRRRDGFLDFQFPEPKVELDAQGVPVRIYPGKRLASHIWIEECMLLANRATSRFLTQHKLPGLFRVHEQPDLDAVAELWATLGKPHKDDGMAEAFKKPGGGGGNLNPAVQKFFIRLLGGQDGPLPASVQRKILQSMKKAQYSALASGHFALGWHDYAHFTSPIRRYADLWTHRVIKAFLRGGKIPRPWKARAAEIGEQISEREIEVMKTERKSLKTATAWILQGYVGDEFTGEVSGVENFGVFVSISDPFGEGLIPVHRLRDDFYEKDPETGHLVGKRTRKSFSLGEKIKVRLERADPFSAQVDFEFLGKV